MLIGRLLTNSSNESAGKVVARQTIHQKSTPTSQLRRPIRSGRVLKVSTYPTASFDAWTGPASVSDQRARTTATTAISYFFFLLSHRDCSDVHPRAYLRSTQGFILLANANRWRSPKRQHFGQQKSEILISNKAHSVIAREESPQTGPRPSISRT